MQLELICLLDGKSLSLSYKIFNCARFKIWKKLKFKRVCKKEPELSASLFRSLEEKLPFVLRLLNHTDDDISECVSEYCMHYISILKINKLQTREQQANIEVYERFS